MSWIFWSWWTNRPYYGILFLVKYFFNFWNNDGCDLSTLLKIINTIKSLKNKGEINRRRNYLRDIKSWT